MENLMTVTDVKIWHQPNRHYCTCSEPTQSIAYEKPFEMNPSFICVTCGKRKKKE